MFIAEVAFSYLQRKHGRQVAMALAGDIHPYTELHAPPKGAGYPLINERQLFDFNEHFMEWGGPVQGRSFDFMILGLFLLLACIPTIWLLASTVWWTSGSDMSQEAAIVVGLFGFAFALVVFGVYWYTYMRAVFLTALTSRYRFNRTTFKVYVLRPEQFGGNAVLDWSRALAHPEWCAPRDLEPGFQHDARLRAKRQGVTGGVFGREGPPLYWPPLDANDSSRRGKDIIWVGQYFSGSHDWEYIRRFMEEGMDAVPVPQADHYRRKGRSAMWQHLWEEQFDPILRTARLMENPDPESAVTFSNYVEEVPFLIFNSMAERLCYWSTFPQEWHSDCGQKRRESGIGPEKPLRWTAAEQALVQKA